MLRLQEITKQYKAGDNVVHALKGISLEFKASEFVCVLGPSGCGKTTMLNIIGGLDRYTSGDLLINEKSTSSFSDSEWDSYRNNTIGFVFQSYNLIPHLTVLDNVEIALTLSGVSAAERKHRAKNTLAKVGLSDQLYKKPNQLSGGQMQRVAIARALVNNPKILLADEPTGALDSATSVQIMELLREISSDRLVIMVTHNDELAKKYGTRTVRLFDGLVTGDTNPYSSERSKSIQSAEGTGTKPKKQKLILKKTSMTFFTALKLSFNNLRTKKMRTAITSVAGSIGIIGIALVLAISSGMTAYVNRMQSETLSGFPLMISPTAMLDTSMQDIRNEFQPNNLDFPSGNAVYPYNQAENSRMHYNKITEDYLEYLNALDKSLYNDISYTRSLSMNLLIKNSLGIYNKATVKNLGWQEITSESEFLKTQFDLLGGAYPSSDSDIVLIVDKRNRVDTVLLEEFDISYGEDTVFKFEDFIGRELKLAYNNTFYKKEGNIFKARLNDQTELKNLYDDAEITLSVCGILRVKESSSSLAKGGIGYSAALTDAVLANSLESDIVLAQKAAVQEGGIYIDVTTGNTISEMEYKSALAKLGGSQVPSSISIYPKSFDSKELIKEYLEKYNTGKETADQIYYTDLAEMVTTAVGTLIDTISIILSAFAAISLVVSSIMIGIITYVSVVERTKEIGILRSIGARKKDISRVFNAETVIIGFTAGMIGIITAVLLSIPVNIIVNKLVAVPNIASLPIASAAALVAISVVLTFIAGLIPSRIAAKKDPVTALRSE